MKTLGTASHNIGMALLLALLVLRQNPGGAIRISPEGLRAVDPQLAVSGGNVAVAFGAGNDIYVSAASGRLDFSSPTKISGPGQISLGMRRGPRIAFGKGTLVVSAVYGRQGKGRDGELLAWRSTDQGRTWSGPFAVSDTPGAAREGLHAMAWSPTGRLACAWLDLRSPGTEIWSSTSEDGGLTWSPNVRVYRSPDGHVCECCHPSIAFGPRGELNVMFRNWLAGSRDMYLATSVDGGRTFATARKLGQGTWPLNACPMDGGSLSFDANGLQTSWRRDGKVYTCRLGQPERLVGEGTQIWTAGEWSVWQTGTEIQARHLAEPAVTLSQDGIRPTVASDSRQTFAAWADANGVVWLKRL